MSVSTTPNSTVTSTTTPVAYLRLAPSSPGPRYQTPLIWRQLHHFGIGRLFYLYSSVARCIAIHYCIDDTSIQIGDDHTRSRTVAGAAGLGLFPKRIAS